MNVDWKAVNWEAKKENKKLENWMRRNYGKRCPTYAEGCILCKMWKLCDELRLLEENTKEEQK